jgi:hypothetical protein
MPSEGIAKLGTLSLKLRGAFQSLVRSPHANPLRRPFRRARVEHWFSLQLRALDQPEMQLVEKRDVYSASVVDLDCVPLGIGEIGMRKHAAVIASGEQSVPVRVTGDVVNTLASGTVQRAPVEQGRSFVPPAVNANADH